jgi:hypothetical protein
MRNLREAILEDLSKRSYLYIHKEHVAYVDNPAIFGKGVWEAFPSAREDIKQAGNCLAADCNTAVVFHLMRAVEWGLRAFSTHLGVKKLTTTRRSGKKTYTPLDFSEWEKIINALHGSVDAKINKLKRGPDKQRDQEFYYPILQDIKGFKDAWRNHVMHTRAQYTRKDAEAILYHVSRFMIALATRVREV